METLGRYKILRELGRGAFGVVYSAMDPRIGRKVAIKTIHADIDQNTGEPFRERLRREAHSAGILSHPHIVTIHELDEIDRITYIAMEFVDGQTLAAIMEREKSLPLEFLLTVTRQTADALDFAHSHGIVHRDVKPANIMITAEGNVKVADFGIAKIVDHDASLTKTGMIVGTAHYMSPEQVMAGKVGGRSDQFALAVIAYEMLTGKRPFRGDSWPSILHQIMTVEPAPVRQYRSDLDDSVTTVLRKALAKNQAERYTSCREFADELSESVFNTTVERPAVRAMPQSLKAPVPRELAETELLPAADHVENAAAPGDHVAVKGRAPQETPLRAAQDATLHVSHDDVTKAMGDGTLIVPPAAPAPATPIALARPGLRKPSRVLPMVAATVVVVVLAGAWIALRSGSPTKESTKPGAATPAAENTTRQIAEAKAPIVMTQAAPTQGETQRDAPLQPFSDTTNPAAAVRLKEQARTVPSPAVATGTGSRGAAENRRPQNLNRQPAATTPPDNSPAELPESTPPLGKYRGPPEGHFSWTGLLAPAARLTITGSRASSGTVDGRGLPLGLSVTAQADPSTIQVVEQPSAANQFRLVLKNSGGSQAAGVSIDWKENRE